MVADFDMIFVWGWFPTITLCLPLLLSFPNCAVLVSSFGLPSPTSDDARARVCVCVCVCVRARVRMCTHVCMLSCFGRVQFWTAACQAPLFMGFSRQENLTGFPGPPPGDLHNRGIEPRYPTLQEDSLPSEPPGKPKNTEVGSLSLL